jgi:ParB-like chromosome segregation protein Spo0J
MSIKSDLSVDEADDILDGLEVDDPVSRAKPPHRVPMSQEFDKVDIWSIKIEENRHRAFDPKRYLVVRDSIKRLGLINPITVTRDLVLDAGLHRLMSFRELSKKDAYFNQIPVQFSDALNKDQRRAIQLEENLKRLDVDWKEKEVGLAELVEINQRLYGWTQKQTADDRGYDKSTISNRLKVAREIKAGNPEVLAAKSAREAERIIARQQQDERARQADMARGVSADEPRVQIITVDCCEWTTSYSGPPFDVGHCDPPWGVGADRFGQGSGPVVGTYTDTPEINARIFRALFSNIDRIFAKEAHLVFWFQIPQYAEVRAMLEEYWDYVDPFLLYWHKTNGGTIRNPKTDPHNSMEVAFLCSRDGRLLQRPLKNVFAHPVVDGHQNVKPISMLRHFLSMIVGPHSRVLDPTCGSGSSIRAAMAVGAKSAIGLEINPDFASRARLALDESGADIDLEELGLIKSEAAE